MRGGVLDRFVPEPIAGRRHTILIHAPADFVMEQVRVFPMESLWGVRALIRLRAWLLGAKNQAKPKRIGLVEQMLGLGWGCLAEVPGAYFVAGGACRPWQGDVVFESMSPEEFATYAAADMVKIAWTLEVDRLGPELTRFATETRVAATDEDSARKFRWYWQRFGAGIALIRWMLLPALRRVTEQRWKERRSNLQTAARSGEA